ncbi:large ribosomal subunit protein mL54-like isoform X2 [Acipenser ruthenus]|uniref:large ribosomal subunit protein mL54-like isoform X2 n=1 Tax=Acipenser ruthenus TaxID=7906 RepID=UPI002742406C|nr:large ribosomal subunit protein mL54-like isoform X2 [Acipenser ruthenus]
MSGIALFGTVRGLRLILSSTHAGAVSSTLPKILACGYAKKVGADNKSPPKKKTGTDPENKQEPTAKGKGKGMAKDAQKGPEVCKDPVKLTTHAMGVNIYKEGQDPPLQAASEYPEWLFQLDLGPPKQLSELDPESREYWKLMRKEHMWRFNKLHKGKKL